MRAAEVTGRQRERSVRQAGVRLRLVAQVRQEPAAPAPTVLAAADRMLVLSALAAVFGGRIPVTREWAAMCARLRADARMLGITLVRTRPLRPGRAVRPQALAPGHQVHPDLRGVSSDRSLQGGFGSPAPTGVAIGPEAADALGRWLTHMYGEGL